ncbi:MAG: GNAT family N-acetyltransferase [Anaerolineales bacterium]
MARNQPLVLRMADMEIVHFDAPLEFQEQAQPYLVRWEAENNLLLGILAGIIGGEYRDIKPYLSMIVDEGKVQTAALCTPPFPVLISYQNPAPKPALLQVLLDDLLSWLGDDFCGLSGNKEYITPLIDLWQAFTGKEASLEMALRIYKLDQVEPVRGVEGQSRLVDESDRDLLIDWYAGFHRDSMGNDPNPTHVRKQVKTYLEADPRMRGMMIWEVGGIPVSMAGYAGPTPHGIRVGAVYTPPEQRRKGYASACAASVSQHLLDQGFQFCFLFTDLMNPTSNHIYQQIGYRPVCDVDRYIF